MPGRVLQTMGFIGPEGNAELTLWCHREDRDLAEWGIGLGNVSSDGRA